MARGHYWVVTCKNTKFHSTQNQFHGHRIPIGRTDEHSPRPKIPDYLDIPVMTQDAVRATATLRPK